MFGNRVFSIINSPREKANKNLSINHHCIRSGNVVGDHKILFTLSNEIIEINHRSNYAHPRSVRNVCDVGFVKDMILLMTNKTTDNMLNIIPKPRASSAFIIPDGIGLSFVLCIFASISLSYHIFIHPAAPAPIAMLSNEIKKRTG